jgi:hypothetical protein
MRESDQYSLVLDSQAVFNIVEWLVENTLGLNIMIIQCARYQLYSMFDSLPSADDGSYWYDLQQNPCD